MLCIHMFLYSIFTRLYTYWGAYACYMSFQSLTCYSLYLYLKLWCMLSSITKKGEIESTSAPWVILVINVNISLVGLILLSSMFQKSSTVEWHGQEDVEPLLDAKVRRLAKAQDSWFSILVIQDHTESIGKPILLKGDECCWKHRCSLGDFGN